jgi:acyl-CoA thioesterase-2
VKNIQSLLKLLNLEPIEENIFRGQSESVGSNRVFGGQVLAQALQSAIHTVTEGRTLHSLHAYFVLPGDISLPIIFEVERTRDGGSFTTRRIKAIQKGQTIFNMAASFQKYEEGFDHQLNMPNVANPEGLVNWDTILESYGDKLPGGIRKFLEIDHPIEFRPVEREYPFAEGSTRPIRHVWMRAKGAMPDDLPSHQAALAYASDYNLLTTALLPHRHAANDVHIQLASIDHAMWFHREFRFDEWLLYALDSPSGSNARGFTRGSIYDQQGRLIASVVQEGLIRPIPKK